MALNLAVGIRRSYSTNHSHHHARLVDSLVNDHRTDHCGEREPGSHGLFEFRATEPADSAKTGRDDVFCLELP
jgi:hypothetical protein